MIRVADYVARERHRGGTRECTYNGRSEVSTTIAAAAVVLAAIVVDASLEVTVEPCQQNVCRQHFSWW